MSIAEILLLTYYREGGSMEDMRKLENIQSAGRHKKKIDFFHFLIDLEKDKW